MFAKIKAALLASGRLCAVLAIFAAVIFLTKIMSTPSSAQSPSIPQGAESRNERVFENKIPKDVPIKIKIKQEKEASFKGLKNEKWLNEFELELTNTGNKPIYFLYITMVTDVKVDNSRLVFPLHYGRAGLGDIVTKAEPDDVPIKPGETYVLEMGEVPAWERGVRENRWLQATKFRAELQALSFGNQPYPPADRRQSAEKEQVQQPKKARASPPDRLIGKPGTKPIISSSLDKPATSSSLLQRRPSCTQNSSHQFQAIEDCG
jgi:hypothetical protein